MKEGAISNTIINLEANLRAIDNILFCLIPKFQRLREKRIKVEKMFWTEEQMRLEKAKKLLDDMSAVATEVFETEFPVKKISIDDPLESVNELVDYIKTAFLNTWEMSTIKVRRATKKFHKAMQKRFGITTKRKGAPEIIRSLLAYYSGRYYDIFDGVADEYHYQVIARKKIEEKAKEDLLESLSFHAKSLVAKWNDGKEEEVIKRLIQIMVEYEAQLKKIPKTDITELRTSFKRFDKKKKEWVPSNRSIIKLSDFSPETGLPQSYKIVNG